MYHEKALMRHMTQIEQQEAQERHLESRADIIFKLLKNGSEVEIGGFNYVSKDAFEDSEIVCEYLADYFQSENVKQLDAGLNEIVWLYAKKLAEIEARENEKHVL